MASSHDNRLPQAPDAGQPAIPTAAAAETSGQDSSLTTDPNPVVPVRLLAAPDYMEAASEFFRDAVNSTMTQLDPNYGALRRVPMPEGVSSISVQVADSETPSPVVAMSQPVEVVRDDVIAGNLEAFHNIVAAVAGSHLETFMTAFYAHLGDAVAAVGNSVDLSGEKLAWDRILDLYEQIEWIPNDLGVVQQPTMQMGTEAKKAFEALPEMTDGQKARFARIAQEKQEDHVSRRRSRRLRGESD